MKRTPVLPLLAAATTLLAALPACKKAEKPTSGSDGESEQAKVDRMCEGLNDLSLAYIAGLSDMDIDGKEVKKPAVKAKLRELCKGLDVEVVRCAKKLAITDPKCDRALEQAMGMTDARPQGEGPKPAWSLALPFEIYNLEPGPGGALGVTGKTQLARVEDGEIAWQVELEDASTHLAWLDGCLLTGAGAELRCYDAAGEVAWKTQIASGASAWLSAIEAGPEAKQATVVSSEGDIFRVDGAVCASDATAEGCATKLGRVPELAGMRAVVLADGALLGSSDTAIALVSAKGELLVERPYDYATSFPAGALVVGGHEILRAKPDCAPKADDCFEVVHSHEDMELTAPVELADGGLVFTDRYGVLHKHGDPGWEIDAGNDGDPILHGGVLYSVGHVLGLDEAAREAPPQLRAVDPATGKTRWIVGLGEERAGLMTGYVLEAGGERIYVGFEQQLFAVPAAKAG